MLFERARWRSWRDKTKSRTLGHEVIKQSMPMEAKTRNPEFGVPQSRTFKSMISVQGALASGSGAATKPIQRRLRFLDLPGEIRNLIYEFVLGPNPGNPIALRRLPRRSGLRSFGSLQATNKPPFVGLTQASRQVRAEFGTLYASALRIRVLWDSVEEYLQTFCNPQSPLNNIAPGMLIVMIRKRTFQFDSKIANEIDFAPICRFVAAYPGSACYFTFDSSKFDTNEKWEIQKVLNVLNDIGQRTRPWARDVKSGIIKTFGIACYWESSPKRSGMKITLECDHTLITSDEAKEKTLEYMAAIDRLEISISQCWTGGVPLSL